MDTAIITGSAGLIGSESARFFHNKGFRIVGVDNDILLDIYYTCRQSFYNHEPVLMTCH